MPRPTAREKLTGGVDPYSLLADELMDKNDDAPIWISQPVDIVEFVESPTYMNLKFNGRRGCRPKILEILIELAKDEIREAMILLGKGSGKDFLSSIFHLYGIHKCLCLYSPQVYLGISSHSPIYFVNVARNERQALRVFFAEMKGMLENSPWFAGIYHPLTSVIEFPKNITALSGNSHSSGWLGFNTLQWVGDELAYFLIEDSDEESASTAEASWDAAYGSCKTRFEDSYKMVGITTPKDEDDFVIKKAEELKKREDGFTIQLPSWDIIPGQTIESYAQALASDYRKAMRDFGAQPTADVESFWPIGKEDLVRELSNDGRTNPYLGGGAFAKGFAPVYGVDYYIHFDLSTKKDHVGVAMAHCSGWKQFQIDEYLVQKIAEDEGIENPQEIDELRIEEKPLIYIDYIAEINPRDSSDSMFLFNNAINFQTLRQKFVYNLVDKGFNIVKVTADQFQSHEFSQQIVARGIEFELISVDRDDTVPGMAKEALSTQRVDYPYHEKVCDESKHLRYFKRKVDHQKRGSKDVWDAFAASIYLVIMGSVSDLSSFVVL